ncbi:hypothetical protein B0H16DRAFT_1816471 [Mycena metata]|uniref:PHD-type domain-containing protein n=1 Tax=Mycena metata TaxID=1033252 RepID=A0AAD7H4Z4_9AGAR|nr:hypothetical protein B0H16DRAFT_1816471 [Mycena metata]
MDFVEKHNNLHVHWATATLGGRGGSTEATGWEQGKLTRRACQGAIQCEDAACQIITRPQTRRAGIDKQLEKSCACGAKLSHQPCEVISSLYTFKGGVYYQNGGTHLHPHPTVRLHLAKKEKDAFAHIVQENPTAGPLKLLVGRPGGNGAADSVADISPVLINAERIKYERRRVLKPTGGQGGDNFVKEFGKFDKLNPNFVRTAQFGEVSVVALQTPFMASRLLKSVLSANDGVDGVVSDAAHGYWRERNSLLIVSSTYEPTHLKCWVPVLISYSNGGTAEHYRIHFFELFCSIAEEYDARKMELNDDCFANVVDFSSAERNGFILAFVDFWLQRAPGERTVDELLDVAPKLLKGCAHHFRSQITRVKKISGVVDPAQADVFENYGKKLLQCETPEEFNLHATEFIKAFPRAESWIRWWMLPAYASMLFPSFRVMKPALWEAIPDTTNAEEATHWKLYAVLGKHLALLEGLRALVAFTDHYRVQFEAKRHGIKTHYGTDREHWKRTAQLHGRTKYTRTKAGRPTHTKNDGRPPDTGKALLLGRKSKSPKLDYEKGYVWKNNSCWLDSSLTAIASAATRDFQTNMDIVLGGLPPNHPLFDLRQLIHSRMSIELRGYEPGGCSLLSNQRDGFIKVLRDHPQTTVKSLAGFGSLFGWLYDISAFTGRITSTPAPVERASAYFRMLSVTFRTCPGTGHWQPHFQLERIKLRKEIQLHSGICEKYGGSMRQWFADFMQAGKAEPLVGCWRAKEGECFCDGDTLCYEIILNIPAVLIIQLGDVDVGNHWEIPGSLHPFPNNSAATAHRVKYTLTSHLYANPRALHFIARYSTVEGGKTRIYDYDGKRNEGHAVLQSSSTFKGLLTGSTDSLKAIPKGYKLYAVVYHLDGGEAAQKYFRKEQLEQSKKLGLHFEVASTSLTGIPSTCELRRQNVERLSDEDRGFWAPAGCSAAEYEHTPPQKSPRKSQVWHAPMAPPKDPALTVSSLPSENEQDGVAPKSSKAAQEDSIDKLILNTLEAPASKRRKSAEHDTRSNSSDSTTPCPIHCYGCGLLRDGDNDPEQVQCLSCGFWSHFECQPNADEVDWNSPDVSFTCDGCRARPPELFFTGEIVMLPDPFVMGDWRSDDVLWYPAKFLKHHPQTRLPRNEFEFRFSECNDWDKLL